VIRTRAPLGLAGAAVLASSLFIAFPARAVDARAEAAAKDALKKAANDFESEAYATAVARLDAVVASCGVNRCSPTTKALVLRDLGTMQFRSGDKAAAANSFAKALKIDPDLALAGKYAAPDIRAVWDRAKAATAAPPPEPAPGRQGRPGRPGRSEGEQSSADFTHAPAAEQKADTPVPVYVEIAQGKPPPRIIVKYKGAKMSEWGEVDLGPLAEGWGGLIPCEDVAVGKMRYWIQGVDRGGTQIMSAGDPKHPYTVPIRTALSGEAPHLPNQPPPQKCAAGGGESSEGEGGGKGGGKGGGGDDEQGSKGGGQGSVPVAYARVWLGAALSLDFLSMPSGNDLCGLDQNGEPLNSMKLYCTNPDGSDFPSRLNKAQDMALVPGKAGQIGGGLTAGDIRVMLSVDYALKTNILVGGRLGYVANAYTGSSASKDGRAAGFDVHIEARATYLFGVDPLLHAGFAPMAFAGFGLAEFDGHASSNVTLNNVMGQQPVEVWRTDGPFFLLLGGGVRYQFSPRAAFTGALRINIAVGNGVLGTYGPEIGAAYGF